MKKIIIIDDNTQELELISSHIQKEFQQTSLDVEITSLNDPFLYDFSISYDIIFIDIEMPKNGIQLANEIYIKYPLSKLIFITHRDDLVFDSFQAHPFQFIKKELFIDSIAQTVRALEKYYILVDKTIEFKSTAGLIKIKVNDIDYIESHNHRCTLHTKNNQVIIWNKLNEIESMINAPQMCRVHQSYLVNLTKVSHLEQNGLYIQSHYIPISRAKKNTVKESYLQYTSDL